MYCLDWAPAYKYMWIPGLGATVCSPFDAIPESGDALFIFNKVLSVTKSRVTFAISWLTMVNRCCEKQECKGLKRKGGASLQRH